MLVASSINPSAPSPNLLRFLRYQSESFFFTSNPTRVKANAANIPASGRLRNSKYGNPSWVRLNSAPCLAQIEASLFSPWPSPKISTLRKSSHLPSCPQGRPNGSFGTPFFVASRSSSTKSQSWWQNWLCRKEAYLKWKNSNNTKITTFTDEEAEGNLFNLGQTLASKSHDEPRLRCTEFDENGNVTLVNGEFRKSELIAKVCLPPSKGWSRLLT
jgi:magnesium transporter